ncbi:MAG: formate dehydrogenase [Burkholderiales bacterium]|nr:formate dehydrogenase [Burkholderiales bacterium]OUT76785.1 MAG: formate dehydrogenase [Betaproteobacteria bacterium TMED22]|tara:strand:- start:30886 stop:32445 length:1560 start_codon:yes stop_codon:yes gene_type:complete
MTTKIYIPRDSSAIGLGADVVADQVSRVSHSMKQEVEIVRNGSRGLIWMEPLLEVETESGRSGFANVNSADVEDLVKANFTEAGLRAKSVGIVDEIPYLKNQERLCFARNGITDPISIEDYIENEGFKGLRSTLDLDARSIVDIVTDSGLRGRGGAAFPTGIKWNTVLNCQADQKYIVCNADEGDSGTFSDRMTMEGDPFALIEGMTIAAFAVHATKGYVYLRSEYPHAEEVFNAALDVARDKGYLGKNIRGGERSFDIELRRAAGAYICGEETSLLESLEGKRGLVRAKPPLPAISGLFGKPTVVNNVITFSSVPFILANGGSAYKNYGMGRSTGTLPIQLAGNIKQGGLVEKAFGVTLNELLYDFGGGSASGKPIRTVQIGGPLGAYIPEKDFDLKLDYETFAAAGAMIGHGGIVVFDETVNMASMARFAMEFCAIESCGKCTPCRIGSTRGMETIDKILSGEDRSANAELIETLCDTMLHGSLCALGGMIPFPVMSAIKHFPEDFCLEPHATMAAA